MAALAGREVKKLPTLRGRTVVNLFYEDSTRTRISFEAAAKRLSADVINFSAKGSSVSKGESLKDTALTLQAMGADAVVIRHSASGAPHRLAALGRRLGAQRRRRHARAPDAGAARRVHDALAGWAGSPGCRSRSSATCCTAGWPGPTCCCCTRSAPRSRWSAPPTLVPVGRRPRWPADVRYDLDAVLPDVDVVMMLRVQRERMGDTYFPSAREYARRYGLDARAHAAAAGARDRHAPGPMNRGMEIAPEVADSARSTIVEQVANGVSVRMAVLYLLLGGMTVTRRTCIKDVASVLGAEPTDLLLRDGVVAEVGRG